MDPDDELAEEALAADPDTVVADDAVPLRDPDAPAGRSLLPSWYMPAPLAQPRLLTGWRRRVALLIIVSFVSISAYGLCATYGNVSFR